MSAAPRTQRAARSSRAAPSPVVPPAISTDDDSFPVQYIFAKRGVGAKLEFAVRWEKCGGKSDNWVKPRDVSQPLVVEFNARALKAKFKDAVYVCEDLLERRASDLATGDQFKVAWLGFPQWQTWVTASNLAKHSDKEQLGAAMDAVNRVPKSEEATPEVGESAVELSEDDVQREERKLAELEAHCEQQKRTVKRMRDALDRQTERQQCETEIAKARAKLLRARRAEAEAKALAAE